MISTLLWDTQTVADRLCWLWYPYCYGRPRLLSLQTMLYYPHCYGRSRLLSTEDPKYYYCYCAGCCHRFSLVVFRRGFLIWILYSTPSSICMLDVRALQVISFSLLLLSIDYRWFGLVSTGDPDRVLSRGPERGVHEHHCTANEQKDWHVAGHADLQL